MNRVGLFGGTFNPIHRAHIQVAREVLQTYNLDRIYFVPCALPPHKLHGPLAPAQDRLEMARRALESSARLEVSDVEVRRSGPSYTIDTLHDFRALSTAQARLFFLLGLDAYFELHTWKNFRRLLDMASMIIMTRPMPEAPQVPLRQSALQYARRHLSDGYRSSSDGYVLRHADKQPLFLARVTAMDIASSQIRAHIRHGLPVDQWVAPAVADYIDRKGLYR